jgi:outer membrane protein assembly factor BamD (BamD/ComL family)
LFLFYKANIAQEHRGTPSRELIKDFVKAAQFFDTMTNEERLVAQLLGEGLKCLDKSLWQEAAQLYAEADTLDKWRDLYGGTIYASLAYAFAQLGDFTKCKHYLDRYQEEFGEYGVVEEADSAKLGSAKAILDALPLASPTGQGHELSSLDHARRAIQNFEYVQGLD